MLVHETLMAALPQATLQYLCHEIVLAETKARIWERQGIWDKAEWWTAYYERLHDWHYAWVRHETPPFPDQPRLHVCPNCGRMHENAPGWLTCFACGTHWLSRG